MQESLEPKENSVTQAKSKKYLKSSHQAVKLTELTVCFLILELGKKNCAETRNYSELMPASSPDLNQGPSDLQSDALPTELSPQ